jgi:hypothetical protein
MRVISYEDIAIELEYWVILENVLGEWQFLYIFYIVQWQAKSVFNLENGYWHPEYEMRNNFDREGRLQVSIKLIYDKLTWTAFWKNCSVWLSKCYAK